MISAVGTMTAYGSPFCSKAASRVRQTCGQEAPKSVSGNGIVTIGRDAQSHHAKRRGINAQMPTVRRQVCSHGPALLPNRTDPDVGQQTHTNLNRSLLDL